MAEAIDKKYLDGLKYRASKTKKVEKDGRKVTTYEATERNLREEDVLAWRDNGQSVTIVTADGQKVEVRKPAEKKA